MAKEMTKDKRPASQVGLSCKESPKQGRQRLEVRRVEAETESEVEEQKSEGAYGSFTAEEIESLIDNAQKGASAVQGSQTAWRLSSSQTKKELKLHSKEGSCQSEMTGSQSFHLEVQHVVESFLQSVAEPPTVGSLGQLVVDALDILEKPCCRPGSIAGKGDLFPIPVGALHDQAGRSSEFLPAVVVGLNSLHSYGSAAGTERLSPIAQKVCKRLDVALQQSDVLQEPLPELDFKSFFSHRGLDYSGEEVRLAKPISWQSVEASLPPQVGCLDIRDFCHGGVAHFINNIDNTILPVEDQRRLRPPSVMIEGDGWEEVAHGLVSRGLCQVVPEDSIFKVQGQVLLNGLFSVAKDEIKDGIPLSRLIMNLKPWNQVSRCLVGDVGTLPSVTQLGALHLHDDDVLVTSSEDLRCFFYLFRTPPSWVKYMAFGKEVPSSLVPMGGEGKKWYLAGQVLPMGYLNSVGVAQHIHRAVIQRAIGSIHGLGLTVQEIRRDRSFSHFPNLFRVYLDNFDQLQKVDRATALLVAGTPSSLVEQLREFYEDGQLPRHPKKSVEQSLAAEVQGAWLDGDKGVMFAKPAKVAKYVRLALELVGRGRASRKELQVVGGGFVYIAMFNRPLLSSLNQIWRMIVDTEQGGDQRRRWLKREVMVELVRFIGLCPLSFMQFRTPFDSMVTASDASTSGGGICKSVGLTPYGQAASLSYVRGDVPEELELVQVLSVGLFDGISALRVALDVLKAPVAGHISVESKPEARRVLEANFPECEHVEDVALITEEMVQQWSMKYSGVGLVLLGSGPPCQGVSGLNSDRKGALKDIRSRLFQHVPRVKGMLQRAFPWAQVHSLTENVASMDYEDCETMNQSFGLLPWFMDADGISLAHRPRLYWISWEVQEEEGAEIYLGPGDRLPLLGQINLKAEVNEKFFLEKGWSRTSQKAFPTFTTARPSPHPLRRPAGLKDCNPEEVSRWKGDQHRFPPYQYMEQHCLRDSKGILRTPSVLEREVILGFPPNYTLQCQKKDQHGRRSHEDCRLTLLGNSWCVGVVAWLLQQLLRRLGHTPAMSIQHIVDELTPGQSTHLQSLLLRPPLTQGTQTTSPSHQLTRKLAGLVSLKGEDLLLQSTSEIPVKYHRLRSGIPGKLWRWKTVAGWRWKGDPEHINVLEARAVLTTVRWRVMQQKQLNVRCVHLVDSLVVLHALTRGRSSSRKMRRTMMRISSYLLATGLKPLWGYINTKENPADRPSRWGLRKKWLKK